MLSELKAIGVPSVAMKVDVTRSRRIGAGAELVRKTALSCVSMTLSQSSDFSFNTPPLSGSRASSAPSASW